MSKKDEPAFPMMPSHTNPSDVDPAFTGLSKRELFAAMAMQGLCVPCIPGHHNSNDESESDHKAHMAVRLADALIKRLEQDGE